MWKGRARGWTAQDGEEGQRGLVFVRGLVSDLLSKETRGHSEIRCESDSRQIQEPYPEVFCSKVRVTFISQCLQLGLCRWPCMENVPMRWEVAPSLCDCVNLRWTWPLLCSQTGRMQLPRGSPQKTPVFCCWVCLFVCLRLGVIYVTQSSIELVISQMLTLNFRSSCLCLLSSRVTDMHHHLI